MCYTAIRSKIYENLVFLFLTLNNQTLSVFFFLLKYLGYSLIIPYPIVPALQGNAGVCIRVYTRKQAFINFMCLLKVKRAILKNKLHVFDYSTTLVEFPKVLLIN